MLLAPFFVWFEILFYFGYRPELRARIEEGVLAELKRLEEEKAQKRGVEGEVNGKANGVQVNDGNSVQKRATRSL